MCRVGQVCLCGVCVCVCVLRGMLSNRRSAGERECVVLCRSVCVCVCLCVCGWCHVATAIYVFVCCRCSS